MQKPNQTMLIREGIMCHKFFRVIINPLKWKKLGSPQIALIWNPVRYGKFFVNRNSKKYWDDKLAKVNDFWRDENYHHIIEFLPQNVPFSLLDIGCAVGDGCECLQKIFPKAQISGSDISPVGIEKARKKTNNVHYVLLDILRDLIPEKYTYITIIETLEHFTNPFEIVDKCLKHTNKSLIISTPYTPEYSGKMISMKDHVYAFNENTFERFNVKNVKITEFIKGSQSKCIIYEVVP